MSIRWSAAEEDLLVENLELGHDLHTVSMVLQRTPYSIAMKLVDLTVRGKVVVLAPATFDALSNRSRQ